MAKLLLSLSLALLAGCMTVKTPDVPPPAPCPAPAIAVHPALKPFTFTEHGGEYYIDKTGLWAIHDDLCELKKEAGRPADSDCN